MRLQVPADGPSWLARFSDSILDMLRSIMPAPFKLWRGATTELPAAADYTGALGWNTTTVRITYSDGSAWKELQAYDATLAALANYNTTGIVCQTAADTFAGRTLTAPAAGLAITNPAGTVGNPTFALANDLAGLEGLASTGFAARTATDTWAVRSIAVPAAGLTITNPAGIAGNPTLALANDLAAVEALATTGIVRRTGTDTWSAGAAVSLTSEVTGTLPVLNGGTGVTASVGAGTSNVLGDTGTFTPALKFGGGNTGMTATVLGRYQRVGLYVFFDLRVTLTAKGSSTLTASISGLPFTSDATGGTAAVMNVYCTGMSGIGAPVATVGSSAASLFLSHSGATGAALMTDANFTNTSEVYVTGFYHL